MENNIAKVVFRRLRTVIISNGGSMDCFIAMSDQLLSELMELRNGMSMGNGIAKEVFPLLNMLMVIRSGGSMDDFIARMVFPRVNMLMEKVRNGGSMEYIYRNRTVSHTEHSVRK